MSEDRVAVHEKMLVRPGEGFVVVSDDGNRLLIDGEDDPWLMEFLRLGDIYLQQRALGQHANDVLQTLQGLRARMPLRLQQKLATSAPSRPASRR